MIKFFRNIRKRLLSEGKTGKYFKYAIGEIVLVVIGILIALQVNNWNEKRIKLYNEKNLIASIVDEVKASKINLSTDLQQNNKIFYRTRVFYITCNVGCSIGSFSSANARKSERRFYRSPNKRRYP